jgi:hypothetical protein
MFRNKTIKKNRFLSGVLIISLGAISFVLISGIGNAYERPEFTDGLTADWHPGSFCIPCHYTLASTERAKEISSGCTCHSQEYMDKNSTSSFKIDMSKIFTIHKNIICIRCHVGEKSKDNITAADIHRVMSKTPCSSCHVFANGTYLKPQKTGCSDCHGGDPHVVHGARLDKMCVACHGDFGEKYANKLVLPYNATNISLSVITKQQNTLNQFPTIGQILTGIIQALIR